MAKHAPRTDRHDPVSQAHRTDSTPPISSMVVAPRSRGSSSRRAARMASRRSTTTRAYREAAQGRGRSIDAVTPHVFIAKWRASELKERSASQEHFLDLCLLGEPTPTEADPSGEAYCFERGARKGHRRRRLGRRLEAALLRVGVQGAARGPRRRLRPAPVVLAGAGETAAADRLRHGTVPDPHELDEQRQPDA